MAAIEGASPLTCFKTDIRRNNLRSELGHIPSIFSTRPVVVFGTKRSS